MPNKILLRSAANQPSHQIKVKTIATILATGIMAIRSPTALTEPWCNRELDVMWAGCIQQKFFLRRDRTTKANTKQEAGHRVFALRIVAGAGETRVPKRIHQRSVQLE
jgi:hypothetical protein